MSGVAYCLHLLGLLGRRIGTALDYSILYPQRVTFKIQLLSYRMLQVYCRVRKDPKMSLQMEQGFEL